MMVSIGDNPKITCQCLGVTDTTRSYRALMKKLKSDCPCMGSDLAKRFECNVPNPDVLTSSPIGVFFSQLFFLFTKPQV